KICNARWLSLVPVSVTSVPAFTVNELPDCNWRIPESCQPLPKSRSVELANLGLSTTAETLRTCRRSPPETLAPVEPVEPQLPRRNLLRPGVIPVDPGWEITPSLMQCDHV